MDILEVLREAVEAQEGVLSMTPPGKARSVVGSRLARAVKALRRMEEAPATEAGTSRAAIAQRLREARGGKFPTAADAARALAMLPVTLRAHESGQNAVPVEVLVMYAGRYGVTLDWLITGNGDARVECPSCTAKRFLHQAKKYQEDWCAATHYRRWEARARCGY